LFPGTVATLAVGRPQSLALLRAVSKGDVIAVAVQRDPATQDPSLAELFRSGLGRGYVKAW
jgi:ATP-dependent Lon protease